MTQNTIEQTSLAERVNETFLKVLKVLKQLGLFRQSPKFFIIYAHENDNLNIEANKELVAKYISWFKELLFNVDSDKSPHGYGPAYSLPDNGISIDGASIDIVQNQLCLLPRGWHDANVDYVLVFYSELLAKYMHDKNNYQTYSKALFDACNKYSHELEVPWKDVCEAVRGVQQKFSETSGFHHVLTELALLDFRNRVGGQYVIPVLLFDEEKKPEEKWPPDFAHMENSVIRLKYKPGEEHQLFFKILREFETLKDARPLVDELEKCFQELVDLLRKETLKPEEYDTQVQLRISGALQNLNSTGHLWVIKRPITQSGIRDILNMHSMIDRMSMRRVSGKKLPENLSDISLVVAECPGSSDKESASKKSRSVPLNGLFDETELGKGRKIRPKRVFIQGKPGVGKTTLCKRIMYDYSVGDNLRGKFDLVVRIPVRKLERFDNLTQLLFDEYFQVVERGRGLAEHLNDIILGKSNAKILIILDGLDEAREWSKEKLEKLMNQHTIIITSRFYEPGGPFDLRLEAVGLTTVGIKAYVGNTDIVPHHTGEEILDFIRRKPFVVEIFRVPILLDILCYSWGELRRQNTLSVAGQDEDHYLPTITSLYQAVVRTLWRKDIPQLGKLDQGELITTEIANAVQNATRLERLVRAEIILLRELGITMMESDQVEFAGEHIGEAVLRLEKKGIQLPLSLERNFNKLSFVHFDTRGRERRFSFIHLTLQEFFAAQWLTEHLAELNKYLKKYKYNNRFDNVWRFVAGLLQNKDGNQLCDFFNALEKQPRDLLGPGHQRLVMRCLSEVVPLKQTTSFRQLRTRLEGQLSKWLLFECEFTGLSRLSGEIEAPEEVLSKILRQGPPDLIRKFLASFGAPRQKPRSIIALAVDWLKDGVDKSLRLDALKMLQRHAEALSHGILMAVVATLEDDDKEIKSAGMDVLKTQLTLSEDILRAAVKILEDEHDEVSSGALWILRSQSTLPKEILEGVSRMLKHENECVRFRACQVLESRFALPENILNAVIEMLENEERFLGVISAASEALGGQSNLSERIFSVMEKKFGDEKMNFQARAIQGFAGRSTLPNKILEAVIRKLEHEKINVRMQAVWDLKRQSTLPWPDVVAKLGHEDVGVRLATIQVLSSHSAVPEASLKEVAAMLENEDNDFVIRALEGFAQCRDLPKTILEAIAAKLHDGNSKVISQAIMALGEQSSLPPDIVEDIAAKLARRDRTDKSIVLHGLRGQSNLPLHIVEAVGAKLADKNMAVVLAAGGVLGGQSCLPPHIMEAIAAKLADKSNLSALIALNTLRKQSGLPTTILRVVAAKLEYKDRDGETDKRITTMAAAILGGQSTLTAEILHQYVEPIYRNTLFRSFTEHLCWYVVDKTIYIERSGGRTLVDMSDQHLKDEFMVRWAKCTVDWSVPYGNTRKRRQSRSPPRANKR